MLRLVSDENVPGALLRGLRFRAPGLDLVRVQDVGLSSTPDPLILEWAATEDRIVITRDVSTLIRDALERVAKGQPMPGVFVLREGAASGQMIADLLLAAECYPPDEMQGQIRYIPL